MRTVSMPSSSSVRGLSYKIPYLKHNWQYIGAFRDAVAALVLVYNYVCIGGLQNLNFPFKPNHKFYAQFFTAETGGC